MGFVVGPDVVGVDVGPDCQGTVRDYHMKVGSVLQFPQVSTNKHPFQVYFSLFRSSGPSPVTYTQSLTLSVLPPPDTLSSADFGYFGSTYDSSDKFPGFLRFECRDFN